MSVDNVQPTLMARVIIKTQSKGDSSPIGTVTYYTRERPPIGWAWAEGQKAMIVDFPDLFALMGHSFSVEPVPETWLARLWRWMIGRPPPTRLRCAPDEFHFPDFSQRAPRSHPLSTGFSV